MSERSFTLWYDGVPKSLNEGGAGSRRHWGAAYREKKEWQEIYSALLMEAGVPRGASFITVTPTIIWHNRVRRDEPNYEAPISKPFLDALVLAGIIADDAPQFVTVERLKFGLDVTRNGPQLRLGLVVEYE